MTVSDLGFTLVAPASGTALVCERGSCFTLRSAATKPAKDEDEDEDGPWVNVRLARSGPHERPVSALSRELLSAHLSDVPVDEATGGDSLPTVSLDDVAASLAATPSGTPSVVNVYITGGMLNLDEHRPIIDGARATGTRVAFIFSSAPTSG